jgi:hypothetical protein
MCVPLVKGISSVRGAEDVEGSSVRDHGLVVIWNSANYAPSAVVESQYHLDLRARVREDQFLEIPAGRHTAIESLAVKATLWEKIISCWTWRITVPEEGGSVGHCYLMPIY